jgi:type II secretory pathway pseudopilin PulG
MRMSIIAGGRPHLRHGLTVIEVLLVIGVVLILLGLALPPLARSRESAAGLKSLANIRQLGQMVVMYADGNRERPPQFFEPKVAGGTAALQDFRYGTLRRRGTWWNNKDTYFFAFDAPPPADVLLVPGAPLNRWLFEYNGGVSSGVSHYHIAETFYAEPRYFLREGQDPSMWHVQMLSGVRYPSDKGFMKAVSVYHRSDLGPNYPTCCADGVHGAVLWADLSGSEEIVGRLRPGVPNHFNPGTGGGLPKWADGIPIDETEEGNHGRDRW